MIFQLRLASMLACLTLSLSTVAAPLEVAGVKVDDPISLNGTKLVLNGAGTRYKAIFKVYVAAMYVGKRASTPEEIYAAPGPKRLSITLLRDIDSSEIGKIFTQTIQGPSLKGGAARLIPELTKIEEKFLFNRRLLAGENLTIDWIPGTGTVITVKGQRQGESFSELEIFNTLLGIWIGPYAADWKLRDALLGNAF
jgi:hypothetical protein